MAASRSALPRGKRGGGFGVRAPVSDASASFSGDVCEGACGTAGINGVDAEDPDNADSVGAYANDTLVSGGQTANPLVQALAEGSVGTLHWLRSRVHVPLDRVSQLGGHSHARTHRPSSGLAGSELVNALKRQLGVYERQGQLTVMKKTRATRLLLDKVRP
jgi:aspartate oxidase